MKQVRINALCMCVRMCVCVCVHVCNVDILMCLPECFY